MKVTPATAVRLVNGRLDLSHPDALNENPTADRAPRGARSAHTTDPHPRPPRRSAELDGVHQPLDARSRRGPRMVDLQQHLNAALLACSLNIGPTRMAEGDCTSVRRQLHRDEPSARPYGRQAAFTNKGNFQGPHRSGWTLLPQPVCGTNAIDLHADRRLHSSCDATPLRRANSTTPSELLTE